MARKNKYETEVRYKLPLIEEWAKNGLTNAEIAKNLGITEKTFYEWQKRYREFREALIEGKSVSNEIVEGATFRRAIGYDYEEIKITTYPDGTEKMERWIKHMPADKGMNELWNLNRNPDRWKKKQEVELSGGIEHKMPMENLTEEELRLIINMQSSDDEE